MNPLVKSALLELQNDGIILDPIVDFDHLLALAKLADSVTTHMPIGEACLLRPTLQIGNVTLRHLSLGAQRFMIDVVAGKWWPHDTSRQNIAYAYCMAHADRPELLWQHQANKMSFIWAVLKWECSINVSWTELQAAIEQFQREGQQDQTPDTPPAAGDYRAAMATLARLRAIPETYRADCEAAIAALEIDENNAPGAYGPMIELLCREYGHDPEYWMWRISARDRSVIIAAFSERKDAEARAARGHGDDRLTRAHHAFSTYVEKLRKAKMP